MNKPYLVMIPDWSTGSWIWKDLVPLFSLYANVVLIDWPVIEDRTGFIKKVVQTVETLQDSPVILMGWSIGAMLAMEASLFLPGHLEKLVLISSTSCFIQKRDEAYQHGWPKRVVELMKKKLKLNKVRSVMDYYQTFLSKLEIETGLENRFMELSSGYAQKADRITMLSGLDYLIHADLRQKLKDMQIPILLLHGANDTICPLTAAEYIVNNKAGRTRLVSFPDLGHVPFMKDPEEFAWNVIEFIMDKPESH